MGNSCEGETSSDKIKESLTPVEKHPFERARTGVSTASLTSETTKSLNSFYARRKRIDKMNLPSPNIFRILRPEFSEALFDSNLAEKYRRIKKVGPIQLEDQSTYQGQMKNRLRYGFGELVEKDGSMYEGYWNNDKKNGIGRYFMADGKVYDGVWANGLMNGQGRLYISANEYYEGSFEGGYKSGIGRYYLPDGSYFEAVWDNGKHVGEGVFHNSMTGTRTSQRMPAHY
jgi:hypothetical protein